MLLCPQNEQSRLKKNQWTTGDVADWSNPEFYLVFYAHVQRGYTNVQLIIFKIINCFLSIIVPFSRLLHGYQIKAML